MNYTHNEINNMNMGSLNHDASSIYTPNPRIKRTIDKKTYIHFPKDGIETFTAVISFYDSFREDCLLCNFIMLKDSFLT